MSEEWSVFDKYSESTCECACGKVFRSHARYTKVRGLISRKPCPACGKDDHVRKASSDVETEIIGR